MWVKNVLHGSVKLIRLGYSCIYSPALLNVKCLQVQLRRAMQSLGDSDSDLYQWFEGSKLCSGPIESLITLEDDGEAIEMKVRGPQSSELACFYFIEELLGIVDQVEL